MASSEISASEGVEDERKREALRKAGQEYFERVLAEASTGKDPFAPEQITEIAPQREKRTGAARRARPQREDPDLEAVGAIISGAKLYILTAIFVGCKAAGFVFFKASLNPLETPGILTFLHLLPLMCVLLGFSGAFDLDPITLEGAKAALPVCIPSMFQIMMVFSALIEGSVLFVLAFSLVIEQLLQMAASKLLLLSPPSQRSMWFCAAGVVGLGMEMIGEVVFLHQPRPSLRTWLALAVWSAAKFAELSWNHLKQSPEHAQRLLGAESASKLTALADAEAGLQPGNVALYNAMVPALPALILGFVGMEGNELIEHELSVPAVTAILLSLVCFVSASVCGLLLSPQLTPRLKSGLVGLSAVGTVVFDAMAMGGSIHVLTVAGVLLAIIASTIVQFLPEASGL